MTAPVRYQLKISGAFPGRKTAMVMVGLSCDIGAYEYVPARATCTCAGRTGSTSTYAARAGCARTGDARPEQTDTTQSELTTPEPISPEPVSGY